MDTSLFLAQVFGLYFLIGGVGMLLHPYATRELMTKWSSDRVIVFFGGFIALLVGTPLILIHNVWEGTWEILVTIIVWITFLKGVVRILAPDAVVNWTTLVASRPNVLRGMLVFMTLVGVYLCYVGFLV